MADRTVKVTLVAQATGYIAGMDQAARKTRELGSEAERLAQKRAAFEGLGRGMIALGVAAAIGIGFAVAKFVEFDQAMSQTNAILQETTENQKLLRDAALDAGGATVFTATESANAIEELGKAGLSTAFILGGALRGSLDLAAAGQLSVARAAEITGITLKQFGLDGSQAGRVADTLAAAANKAVGGVEELAQGLKFVGPVADSMNVSLEDTVATLALFADRGVLGEQAGTSLRGVLAALTSPSKEAKKAIDDLGITLYDNAGSFLGLENAAGELHDAFTGLTDAEQNMAFGLIFGNMQVTAARLLVEAGAETWREYRDAVEDSGIAQRIAAERMDNLAGDLEKLGGAFDTALIQSGSGANDVLRGLTQSLTFLVDLVGEADPTVLAVGLAFGVATAAVLLFSGTALLAIPRLADLKLWMSNVGLSAGGLAARMATATVATAAITLAVGYFVGRAAEAAANADEFRESLNQTTGAMTGYTREMVAKKLAEEGAFKAAREAGVSQRELTDAVIHGGAELDAVYSKLSANNTVGSFFTGVGIRAGVASDSIRGLRGSLEQSERDWADLKAAGDQSAFSLGAVSFAATDTTGAVEGLTDAISKFNEQQFRADDAVFNFKQSLLDLDELMGEDGFTGTLNLNSQEGIDNSRALRDIAGAANEAAAEILALSGDQDAANAVLDEARSKIAAVGEQFGLSGDELEAFINKYVTNPTDLSYQAEVSGLSQADAALKKFRDWWNGKSITFRVATSYAYNSGSVGGIPQPRFRGGIDYAGAQAFASGGFPSGIYGGVPGGIHKFAESDMGVPWETYISGRSQDRDRNLGLWAKTGELLGAWKSAPQYMAAPSGSGDSQPPIRLVLQPKGGIDLLKYIDVQVEGYGGSTAVDVNAGGLA